MGSDDSSRIGCALLATSALLVAGCLGSPAEAPSEPPASFDDQGDRPTAPPLAKETQEPEESNASTTNTSSEAAREPVIVFHQQYAGSLPDPTGTPPSEVFGKDWPFPVEDAAVNITVIYNLTGFGRSRVDLVSPNGEKQASSRDSCPHLYGTLPPFGPFDDQCVVSLENNLTSGTWRLQIASLTGSIYEEYVLALTVYANA